MDHIVLYPSIGLGLIIILVHLYKCHQSKRSVNLAIIINAVLAGSGIICGGLLMWGSFDDKIMKRLTGINIYIFIAGIAVLFVSAQTIYKDLFSDRNKKDDED